MICTEGSYDPAKIWKEAGEIEEKIKIKTGELEYSAGFQYVCIDCKTSYPVNTTRSIAGIALVPDAKEGKALCNSHGIDLCPWCRPDSAPWKNGRGI